MIHTRNLTAGKWCIVRTADLTMCLRAIELGEPVTASPGADTCPSCQTEVKHAKTQRRTRELDPVALLALKEECR